MNTIRKVIEEASCRLERKITQSEISKAIGITQGHLSNVISGKQSPSQNILDKIAEYLDSIDPSHKYESSEMAKIWRDDQTNAVLEEVLQFLDNLIALEGKFEQKKTKTKANKNLSRPDKRGKVEEFRIYHLTEVDVLIDKFQTASAQKKADLKSQLNPSVTITTDPPSGLTKESDRILWKQNEQIRTDTAELLRLERMKMHRDDIYSLGVMGLIDEYKKAVKNEDTAFCEAIEHFGRQRMRKLKQSGDIFSLDGTGLLNNLIEQRRENLLTEEQKETNANILVLDEIIKTFHQKAEQIKKTTLRRNQRM